MRYTRYTSSYLEWLAYMRVESKGSARMRFQFQRLSCTKPPINQGLKLSQHSFKHPREREYQLVLHTAIPSYGKPE